jgi:hypothetical protein
MKYPRIIYSLILIVIYCFCSYTQDLPTNSRGYANSVTLDKDILYSRVTLLENNGKLFRGFLVGLKDDTLLIHSSEEIIYVPIIELSSISISIESQGGLKGLAIGGILGMYLGNLILWHSEFAPTAYWDNEDPEAKAIATILLFGFVGGGIGYLIDVGTAGGTEVFSFEGNEQEQLNEMYRLKKFLAGEKSQKSLHLSVQLSQVITRHSYLPEETYFGYYNRGVSSFNLLRRLQFTYSIFTDLDVGGAISWFGEPHINWYSYLDGQSIEINQIYEGVGYYAVAAYYPFSSVFSNSISWVVGGGIGMGKVDIEFLRRETGGYPDYINDISTFSIHKNLFSALVYTEFNLYLYEEFSLGITADYVYLPEELPGIPELDFSEENLGNYSFGLTIGLHF